MTDLLNSSGQGKHSSGDSIKWFAPATSDSPNTLLHYFDTLANAPRKVDLLLRADEAMAVFQTDMLERLAQHPKLGALIIFGLPQQQRLLIKARAAMLGLHI